MCIDQAGISLDIWTTFDQYFPFYMNSLNIVTLYYMFKYLNALKYVKQNQKCVNIFTKFGLQVFIFYLFFLHSV